MNYDQFADTFLNEVPKIVNNTLIIDEIRAHSLIESHRKHAISLFDVLIESLEALDAKEDRKLSQVYFLLLGTISFFFKIEEQDLSFAERLQSLNLKS